MRHRTHRQEDFSPLRDKSLFNVLRTLFINEFGYENKTVFAEVMIERILQTVEAFSRSKSLLKPGQMLWMAVAREGGKHAGAPMREIPQVPVILDLVFEEDLKALADGDAFSKVRKRRHGRLLRQAFAQGGVLAQSDLSAITLISTSQVRRNLKALSSDNGRLLPYRGSVHDVGSTLTHKVEVARLLESGHLEPEICTKLSPPHSLEAVERYAQTYKNTLKLLQRGFVTDEISAILGIGRRLAKTYVQIAKNHHPNLSNGREKVLHRSITTTPS